jgi:hypothetical protein
LAVQELLEKVDRFPEEAGIAVGRRRTVLTGA